MFASPAPPAAALRPSATQYSPGGPLPDATHQAAAPAIVTTVFIPVKRDAFVPYALTWGSTWYPGCQICPTLRWPALAGPLPQRVPSRLGGFLLVVAGSC